MTTTPETPAGRPACARGACRARFDPVTGAELSAGAGAAASAARATRSSPASPCVVQPGDVADAAGGGSAPQTYRWALGVGILIPVVAGALGFLAFAFVAAAVVVPVVYVVYMYDVNQWEDQPIGGGARRRRGSPPCSASGFTFLWHAGILGSDISPVDFGGTAPAGCAGPACWCWCCWSRS